MKTTTCFCRSLILSGVFTLTVLCSSPLYAQFGDNLGKHKADRALDMNAKDLTNVALLKYKTLDVPDVTAGGDIGTAAATVDLYTAFLITQSTVGQTLTLPAPTTPFAGQVAYVKNTGSASFTMYGTTVAAGAIVALSYNGSTWAAASSALTTPLSGLTAATATNTIDNAANAQTWNWSTASTETPLSMNFDGLTTGTGLALATTGAAALNSTDGLFSVKNTSALTNGKLATFQANSTAGSGLNILTNGNVGIGTTTPISLLTLQSETTNPAQLTMYQYGTNAPQIVAFRAQGTAASPTATQSGDVLLDLKAAGYGASALTGSKVGITMTAAENFTDAANGTQIDFQTTAIGSTAKTTRMTIANNGYVGIGTNAPTSKLTVSANAASLQAGGLTDILAQFGNADATATRIVVDAFGSYPIYSLRRANGTAGTPSAVQSGDALGYLSFLGYGSTAYSSSSRAAIYSLASEAWTDAAQGTNLVFATTPTGSIASAIRMRIDNNGNVGIGATTPVQTLHVEGTPGGSAGIYINNAVPSASNNTLYNDAGTLKWGTLSLSTGSVNGSGTANYIPKFVSSTSVGNSLIFDDGTHVGIGIVPATASKLEVNGGIRISNDNNAGLVIGRADNTYEGGEIALTGAGTYDNWGIDSYKNTLRFATWTANENQVQMTNGGTGSMGLYVEGNVGIGQTSPSGKLDITNTTTGISALKISTNAAEASGMVLYNSAAAFTNSLLYGYTQQVGASTFKLLDLRSNSGGTQSAYIDGLGGAYFAGAVGIGCTPATDYILDVRGTGKFAGVNGLRISGTDGGNTIFQDNLNTNLALTTNGGDILFGHFGVGTDMLIKPGKVGIGTGSPNVRLSLGASVPIDAFRIYDAGAGASYGMGIQASELQMYVPSASHFSFNGGGNLNSSETNEVMRIMATGNVGIGTSYPGARLHIQGNSATTEAIFRNADAPAGKNWNIFIDSNNLLYFRNEGNVGVAISDGATAWTAASDRRLKKDIVPLDNTILDRVMKLNPITYRYKADDRKEQVGFIAQEVEEAGLLDVVDKPATDKDFYGLQYSQFAPYLVKALQQMNTKLESENAALKARLEAIEKKLGM